jgi:hypothetical protein
MTALEQPGIHSIYIETGNTMFGDKIRKSIEVRADAVVSIDDYTKIRYGILGGLRINKGEYEIHSNRAGIVLELTPQLTDEEMTELTAVLNKIESRMRKEIETA